MFCNRLMLNMYASRAKVRRVGGNFLSDSIALSPRRRRVQCLSLSLDKLVPFISVSVSSFANRERRAAHSTEHGARSRQPTILFYSPNRSPL